MFLDVANGVAETTNAQVSKWPECKNWHSHHVCHYEQVVRCESVKNGANKNLPSSCPSVTAWLAYYLCTIPRQDGPVPRWHHQKPKKAKILLTAEMTVISIFVSLHQVFKEC